MGIINSAIYEAKELLENYENVEVDKNTYDNVLKPYLQENGFEFEASGIDANTVHVEIETSNLSNSQYNTIDSIVSSIYDESLNESIEDNISSILKEYINNPKVKLPRGFKFLAATTGYSDGIVSYKGTRYAFAKRKDGSFNVLPDNNGSSWPEGLFESVEDDITYFKKNDETGLSCGINANGELFCGDENSGYNLPNTPANKRKVLKDFDELNESLNEDNDETNNDQIASMIKEKVKKLFDQESDKSDKSGEIDDDGFGFRIVRANGKTLTYSANKGFLYESLSSEKPLDETFENAFDKLRSFEVK